MSGGFPTRGAKGCDRMADLPRRLRLPPLDTPMLEWWAKDYDHIFIAYSPFFRVPGYTPQTAAYGKIYSDRTDVDDILDLIHNPPERPNEAPPDFETTIKETGELVRWADVHAAIGIGDFETFARSAWLWTVEAPRDDRDERIVAGLNRLVQDTGLYSPEEDFMPVILEPVIARFLAAAGIATVTLHDEHGFESRSCSAGDFARGTPPVRLPGSVVSKISSDAPRMLMAWPWDEIAGFICVSDEMRRACPPEQFFEGRYATPDTYVDWLNPPETFRRNPRATPQ